MIHVVFFSVVALGSLVGRYDNWGNLLPQELSPEDGGSILLWNVGILQQVYIASQPKDHSTINHYNKNLKTVIPKFLKVYAYVQFTILQFCCMSLVSEVCLI
jgi:hypothetical protein